MRSTLLAASLLALTVAAPASAGPAEDAAYDKNKRHRYRFARQLRTHQMAGCERSLRPYPGTET